MASYQNSCIYTLRSPSTDKYYIGSTRCPLRKRLWEHKGKYTTWCKDNTGYYCTAFEILKYGDAYIELLEEYPCENVQQLHKKEGEHIRACKDDVVNHHVAGRSKEEYAIATKDIMAVYQQTYHADDAVKARKKAYMIAYRAKKKAETQPAQ